MGETVKNSLRRAANQLGFSYGRLRSFWYCNARLITAQEIDQLRSVAKVLEAEREIRGADTSGTRKRGSRVPDGQRELLSLMGIDR